MSFALHQPSGPLRHLVRSIWSAEYDAGRELPGLIAPDAHVEFVFQLDAPCEMRRAGDAHWRRQPRAMLYAQRHGCVRLRSTGSASMLAFRTSAVVASVVLRRSLRELWDRPVDLGQLIGGQAEALAERLARARPEQRPALAEEWIRTRLAPWDADHARLERLHGRLLWHSDGAPISATAAALGVSERSLRRWFDAATGLAPKQLELSGRLLRACALLRERPELGISDIAHALGFADHAAFANAYRAIHALSPSELRAEPLVFYERGGAG